MPTDNDGTDIRSLLEGAMAADPATTGDDNGTSTDVVEVAPDTSGADLAGDGPGRNAVDGDSRVGRPEPVGAPGRARDATGKFSKGEKSATPSPQGTPKVSSPTQPPKPGEASPTPIPAAGEQSVAVKAPQAWSAAAREKWGQLPPEIQQEVAKREREAKLAIDGATPDRAYARQAREALAPFEPFLKSQGISDTMGAVRGVMQTMQNLTHAPPAQKAQIIKTMMEQFGVPVDELDRQLAGEGQPQAAQQSQYRDPRVDQLMAEIERTKQQRQEASEQKIQSELAAFAESHEFFEDVRPEMSALIRAAGERGQTLTWEQAYNRAVRGNDELWSILEQRKAATAANSHNESTQRARNAASSVRNQPATPVSGGGKKDVRSAIEAAIALHSGR